MSWPEAFFYSTCVVTFGACFRSFFGALARHLS